MFQDFSTYIYFAVAALICIPLHEVSHGWAAYRLGDPTAKLRGRLTLNPIKHFDVVGFLLMVVAGFGWAKPVPVDVRFFRRPKRDMAIVGIAGPLSNFVLSFVCLLITSGMERFVRYSEPAQLVYNAFYFTALLSTGLGVFNLIPISPLDGSKIIGAFLPEKIYYKVLRYEKYGMILLLVLVMAGNILPQFDFFGAFFASARGTVFDIIKTAAELPFKLF